VGHLLLHKASKRQHRVVELHEDTEVRLMARALLLSLALCCASPSAPAAPRVVVDVQLFESGSSCMEHGCDALSAAECKATVPFAWDSTPPPYWHGAPHLGWSLVQNGQPPACTQRVVSVRSVKALMLWFNSAEVGLEATKNCSARVKCVCRCPWPLPARPPSPAEPPRPPDAAHEPALPSETRHLEVFDRGATCDAHGCAALSLSECEASARTKWEFNREDAWRKSGREIHPTIFVSWREGWRWTENAEAPRPRGCYRTFRNFAYGFKGYTLYFSEENLTSPTLGNCTAEAECVCFCSPPPAALRSPSPPPPSSDAPPQPPPSTMPLRPPPPAALSALNHSRAIRGAVGSDHSRAGLSWLSAVLVVVVVVVLAALAALAAAPRVLGFMRKRARLGARVGGASRLCPSTRKSTMRQTEVGERTSAPAPSPAASSDAAKSAGEVPGIAPLDVKLLHVVGHGGQGAVYAGCWLGTAVAVKIVHSARARAQLLSEAELLSKLRHPCVCSFFGICHVSCKYGDGQGVVMELLEISAYDFIHRRADHGGVEPSLCLRIACETAKGIAHLHRNKCMHRDIKTANVMLDQAQHAKVCDFGLAVESACFDVGDAQPTGLDAAPGGETVRQHTAGIGTPRYMAPEMVLESGDVASHRLVYDESCDVYSFGMLLWEVMHLKVPFADSTGLLVALFLAPSAQRPPLSLPAGFEGLAPIICSCWHNVPSERPPMASCVELLARVTSVTPPPATAVRCISAAALPTHCVEPSRSCSISGSSSASPPLPIDGPDVDHTAKIDADHTAKIDAGAMPAGYVCYQ